MQRIVAVFETEPDNYDRLVQLMAEVTHTPRLHISSADHFIQPTTDARSWTASSRDSQGVGTRVELLQGWCPTNERHGPGLITVKARSHYQHNNTHIIYLHTRTQSGR